MFDYKQKQDSELESLNSSYCDNYRNKKIIEIEKLMKNFRSEDMKSTSENLSSNFAYTKKDITLDKLKIKTLPAIYTFENGIVIDRIVGFEDLGNADNFKTEILRV